MDISLALTSLNTAIGISKTIADAPHALEKAELKLKLADLLSTLAEAKIAISDATSIIDEKDDEIARLKDTFSRKEDTVVSKGYFYRKTKEGKPKGMPFCSVCMEKDRLMILTGHAQGGMGVQCPKCKMVLDGPTMYIDEED